MTPRTVAHQVSLSIRFLRQEYWRELPFPSPGNLPDPGIEPATLASPALASGFFTTSATWNINNLRYADDTTLMVEGEEEPLRKVKEENEKADLKLNIQKTKIMASSSITSWQIDGEKKWKQWQILFSWAPKSLWMVTAALKLKDACSGDGVIERSCVFSK